MDFGEAASPTCQDIARVHKLGPFGILKSENKIPFNVARPLDWHRQGSESVERESSNIATCIHLFVHPGSDLESSSSPLCCPRSSKESSPDACAIHLSSWLAWDAEGCKMKHLSHSLALPPSLCFLVLDFHVEGDRVSSYVRQGNPFKQGSTSTSPSPLPGLA